MRISDWSSDVCSYDLEEADAELNHEVDGERDGDPQYVTRQCHDLIALEAEHGDDGEQQRDERDRADPGQKAGFIPFIPPSLDQPFAGEKSSQKGNRSEEHTSELQSLMRNSYAVFCLKK